MVSWALLDQYEETRLMLKKQRSESDQTNTRIHTQTTLTHFPSQAFDFLLISTSCFTPAGRFREVGKRAAPHLDLQTIEANEAKAVETKAS